MKRIVVPVAALAVTVAALAGCSKNDTTSTTATTSAQASSGDKASTTEAKSGTSEKKGATTSTEPTKDGAVTLPGNVTVPDGVSIPGGDLDKTMADAQKCIDMATGYAGLFTPLLGGEVSADDKAKIKTALEDMKQNVPSSIADDIETIESGIQDADSLVEVGQFMSSEKFTTANDAINTYLTTECNKVGK